MSFLPHHTQHQERVFFSTNNNEIVNHNQEQCVIIAIAGASASGKSLIAKPFMKN